MCVGRVSEVEAVKVAGVVAAVAVMKVIGSSPHLGTDTARHSPRNASAGGDRCLRWGADNNVLLEVGGVSPFVKPPTGKSFRFVRACERARDQRFDCEARAVVRRV